MTFHKNDIIVISKDDVHVELEDTLRAVNNDIEVSGYMNPDHPYNKGLLNYVKSVKHIGMGKQFSTAVSGYGFIEDFETDLLMGRLEGDFPIGGSILCYIQWSEILDVRATVEKELEPVVKELERLYQENRQCVPKIRLLRNLGKAGSQECLSLEKRNDDILQTIRKLEKRKNADIKMRLTDEFSKRITWTNKMLTI